VGVRRMGREGGCGQVMKYYYIIIMYRKYIRKW